MNKEKRYKGNIWSRAGHLFPFPFLLVGMDQTIFIEEEEEDNGPIFKCREMNGQIDKGILGETSISSKRDIEICFS